MFISQGEDGRLYFIVSMAYFFLVHIFIFLISGRILQLLLARQQS